MKKSFLYAGLVLFASLLMISCEKSGGSTTPGKTSSRLWPRYDETSKQWGYMNENGEWAFDARFSEVHPFSNGYALARTGNVLEFIGTDGNRISGAPSFQECSGVFSNGYLRFSSGGYWGLMDSRLNVVIDPYYAALGEMSDIGLVSCKKNAGDFYGYIDKNKKQVIDAIYDVAETFVDGIAIVQRGGSYFAINKSAQTVIQSKYPLLESLGNGRVKFYDSERRKYGLMDTQGKEIGSPIYTQINHFTDNGLALVVLDGKYTYIDKDGKELSLSNGRAVAATDFHEGIAFVQYVENGDFEAIGTNGTRKFALQKGEVPYGNFDDGLCLVWSLNDQGKYFYRYINANGDQVRDWIGDSYNGRPTEEPVMTPGVTPTTPTDPTDPTDPTNPTGASMYIKHPWGGGEWTWQPMSEKTEEGITIYYYKGIWSGTGFNINTTPSDNTNSKWFPEAKIAELMGRDNLEAYLGSYVVFIYYQYEGYEIAVIDDDTSHY